MLDALFVLLAALVGAFGAILMLCAADRLEAAAVLAIVACLMILAWLF